MSAPKLTCRTCKWFDPAPGQAMNVRTLGGFCHFSPPSILLVPNPQGMAVQSHFAGVHGDMWCGQHDSGLGALAKFPALLPLAGSPVKELAGEPGKS